MKKRVSLLLVFLIIFSLTTIVNAGNVSNDKTFSGWNSDFGVKFWFIKSFLNTRVSSGTLEWTDVHAYNRSPLSPEIGNGEYYMSTLVVTCSGEKTTYYSLDSYHGSYIWPSDVYWYIAGGVDQNISGTGSEKADFTFFNSDFIPIAPYSNWTNSLSISF